MPDNTPIERALSHIIRNSPVTRERGQALTRWPPPHPGYTYVHDVIETPRDGPAQERRRALPEPHVEHTPSRLVAP